jgi:hypothetical protein
MPVWKGIIGKGFTAIDFSEYVKTVVFDTWRPQFIVLHNTAVPTFAQWHNVSGEQRMKNLESFYRDTQKWSAGPHVFVADDLIWVFTPLNTPGVHSPSWNAIAWGVEIVGDYSVEPLNPAVQQNAISALATLHELMGLDPSTLRLHKEDPKTTHNCPGSGIVKADVQSAVLAQIGTDEHEPGAVSA